MTGSWLRLRWISRPFRVASRPPSESSRRTASWRLTRPSPLPIGWAPRSSDRMIGDRGAKPGPPKKPLTPCPGGPSNRRMDEAAAVARARAGDDEAFRHLVARHSAALFRLAYRMTGNEHDAEDVVQDALLKAYRSLDRFEDRAQVGSWLYRIATNCALDLLRARQRRERHFVSPDRDEDDATPDAPSGAPGPERIAASGDIRRRVEAAMGRMS